MSTGDRWLLEVCGYDPSVLDRMEYQRQEADYRARNGGPLPDLAYHGFDVCDPPPDLGRQMHRVLETIPERHRSKVVGLVCNALSPYVGIRALSGAWGLPPEDHPKALAMLQEIAARYQPQGSVTGALSKLASLFTGQPPSAPMPDLAAPGTTSPAAASAARSLLPQATSAQDKAERQRDWATLDPWERETIREAMENQGQYAEAEEPEPAPPKQDVAEPVRQTLLQVGAVSLPLSLSTRELADSICEKTGQKRRKVVEWLDNGARPRGRRSAPLAGLSAIVPWPLDNPRDTVRRWWISASDYTPAE